MPNFEYKTVALPRSVAKRRKRRQSEADMIAEQLGKVLNEEAVDGWEYVRAETLTTPGQSGLLKQPVPAAYVVLIFKRSRGAWEGDTRNELAPQSEAAPIPQAAPAPPVMRRNPLPLHRLQRQRQRQQRLKTLRRGRKCVLAPPVSNSSPAVRVPPSHPCAP